MNVTSGFKMGMLAGIYKGREYEGFPFMAFHFLKVSNVLKKRKTLCPGSLERILGAL